MSETINKLLQAKTRLSLREPFFSSILFRFPMEATDTVPYAAVTPRGRILYNPETIEKLSVEEVVFLLCHEVLHIAFSHSLNVVAAVSLYGLADVLRHFPVRQRI